MKILLILFALIVMQSGVHGQQNYSLQTEGQFIGISVKDGGKTSDWYQKVFGLSLLERIVQPDSSAITHILKGDKLVIELVQQRNSESKNDYKRLPDFAWRGIFKVGIYVKDIDALVSHLAALNITLFIPLRTDTKFKIKYFMMRDCEGNLLQFFQNIE